MRKNTDTLNKVVLQAAANDQNFSLLKLLRDPTLADQVFDDIFSQVKHRILTRVGPTNADVFS